MRAPILVLCLAALLPTVLAQEPVNACARQCHPQATDVNFPPVVEWGGRVNVIQYAHIFDAFARAPLNTLPPDPNFEKDINAGFLMPSITTKTPVQAANLRFTNNWFIFHQCPGEIRMTAKGAFAACHDHGLGSDVVLAARDIPVYFYVSPDTTEGPVRAGIAPNVQLFARLMAGSTGETSFGQSDPGAATSTLITRPGASDVFELRTVIRATTLVIPQEDRERGYRVELGVYQYNDRNAEVQQRYRVRSGPLFPPRIILPTLDPLSFLDDTVRSDHGTVEYSLRIAGDFGGYDIDRQNATVRLSKHGRDLTSLIATRDVKPYSVNDHDGATNAVRFRYTVAAAQAAGEGPLILDFSVPNRQGTYILHHAKELPFAQFGEAKVLPGAPLAWLCLALLALVVLLRRRSA